MTDAELDQLDELLAVKVMGWHKAPRGYLWTEMWLDAGGYTYSSVIDWHPTRYLDQAMMVADVVAKEYDVTMFRYSEIHQRYIQSKAAACQIAAYTGKAFFVFETADTLSLAICLAARPIAEGVR